MMNNNNCFEKLNITLPKDHPIFTDHLNYNYQHVDVKLYDSSRTFLRHSLPADYFKGEPIHDLMKKYNLGAKIFLIAPGWFYNWHRDGFRMLSFNLLLTDDDDYLTLFAHEYPKEMQVNIAQFTHQQFSRLEYTPQTFYLLNAQIPHMAINYSKKNRYVLTLATFSKTPTATLLGGPADFTPYNNLVSDLAQQGLIADASSNLNN